MTRTQRLCKPAHLVIFARSVSCESVLSVKAFSNSLQWGHGHARTNRQFNCHQRMRTDQRKKNRLRNGLRDIHIGLWKGNAFHDVVRATSIYELNTSYFGVGLAEDQKKKTRKRHHLTSPYRSIGSFPSLAPPVPFHVPEKDRSNARNSIGYYNTFCGTVSWGCSGSCSCCYRSEPRGQPLLLAAAAATAARRRCAAFMRL